MQLTESLWSWIGFNGFVLAMLALDLGVLRRETRVVTLRESLIWTGVWAALALGFNAAIWHFVGPQPAIEFFTGYVIEKSLSADNVFVFALLFSSFAVPAALQHKVLFWGVFGALLLRGTMIAIGAELFHSFDWIAYVFGALLFVAGCRMLAMRGIDHHTERNRIVRWVRKNVPLAADYCEDRFFTRQNGRLLATPLFAVLILVEVSDVIFAVDSIPAVFAITKDPFIVYTSNVFALLGLRSLYFALAGVMHRFRYLKTGLGVVLSFVGVKMLLAQSAWKISTPISLGVVVAVLAASILASGVMPEGRAGAAQRRSGEGASR
jgi:tellurite resistance protein TerC